VTTARDQSGRGEGVIILFGHETEDTLRNKKVTHESNPFSLCNSVSKMIILITFF
jgi:hypothetical protein